MRLVNVPVLLTSGLVLQVPVVNATMVAWVLKVTGVVVGGVSASVALPLFGMILSGFLMAQLQRLPGGRWLPSLAVAGLLYPFLTPMAVLAAALGARVFEQYSSKTLLMVTALAALGVIAATPFVGVGAWIIGGVALVSTQVLARFGVALTLEHLVTSLGVAAFGPAVIQGLYNLARVVNLPIMLAMGAFLHLQGTSGVISSWALPYIGMTGAVFTGAMASAAMMCAVGFLVQQSLNHLYSDAHPYWSQTAQSALVGALVGAGVSFYMTPFTALSYGLLAMSVQNSLSARVSAGLGTVTLIATVISPVAGWTSRIVAGLNASASAGTLFLEGRQILVSAQKIALVFTGTALGTTVFNRTNRVDAPLGENKTLQELQLI